MHKKAAVCLFNYTLESWSGNKKCLYLEEEEKQCQQLWLQSMKGGVAATAAVNSQQCELLICSYYNIHRVHKMPVNNIGKSCDVNYYVDM